MTSGETVAPMTNGKGKRGNGKENEHREQKEHKENGQVAAEMGNETATKNSLNDSGRDTAPNSPDNECLMSTGMFLFVFEFLKSFHDSCTL